MTRGNPIEITSSLFSMVQISTLHMGNGSMMQPGFASLNLISYNCKINS